MKSNSELNEEIKQLKNALLEVREQVETLQEQFGDLLVESTKTMEFIVGRGE